MVNHRDYVTTSEDLRALLRVYAEAAEPLTWPDAFGVINPYDGPRDARRREHKIWVQRQLCLYRVGMDAHNAGYLEVTVEATGHEAFKSSITPAGRAYLEVALEHERDRLLNERARLILDGVDPRELDTPR